MNDDCFGPTFQKLLEDTLSDSVTENIESNLKNYDKDIEKICNLFYQGFIDSINELLHVRTKAKSLKNEIRQVDASMESISNSFFSAGERLNKCRTIEGNILRAIECLQKCLPVFECSSKFSFYIRQKQYFESLKTLETLENECLPTVMGYRFSSQMKGTIPKLKDNIKACSESEFREFLENIRKFSSRIGDVSLRYTKHMQKSDINSIIAEFKKGRNSSSANDLDISAYDLIDFSPIFKTYRIYTELGFKEFFEKDYRQQRKDQIKLVLLSSRTMYNDLEIYKAYISAVIGFFVVEDHVRNTAPEIASKIYLEEIWASSLMTFATNLSINISLCTDPNILLKLKTVTLIAIQNLKSCNYITNHLWESIYLIRDHYNEVLLQRWVHIFTDILKKEQFVPLEINSAQELDFLVENFPFVYEQTDVVGFPKVFPFSGMAPKVYYEAKEFMYASMKFCEDLPLMPNEVAVTVRKAANLLFTKSFSECILALFKNPSLTIPQVIQIILDTKYLDNTAPQLNDFICEMTGTQQNINQMSTKIFQASFEAEKEVGERICSKVDEFFDISDYNWLLVEPTGSASAYITDMIAYLQSTFASFSHILPAIAQTTCKITCKRISQNIVKLLLDEDVKMISTAALQQINLDLMQCEFFAASEPVHGLRENDLTVQFLPARQLLDLLIMEEWSSYLHDFGQDDNRYHTVEPTAVLTILDKIKEAEKKTVFSVLKKSERERKKLRDTVQKQLKNLVDNL